MKSSNPPPPAGPVLAVCGWSGSGKTTLLEQVLPTLCEAGLRVAVIKHDAHGLDLDHPGKDSDRLFRAGGNVVLRGPGEMLVRMHAPTAPPLSDIVARLLPDHDLVLIEGHKDTPMAKVWLDDARGSGIPSGVAGVLDLLPRGPGRPERLLSLLRDRASSALASCVEISG